MKKKNPNIAVLVDWISSPYHIELIAGLEQAGRKKNVNIITFIGGSLNSPKKYESNSNYLYDYIDADYIDGIIIESGILGLYSSNEDIMQFLSGLPAVPVVSISKILDNVPSIIIENSEGFEHIILHLIEKHQCRTFAFISGPETNTDSRERLITFKKTLEKNDIKVNPDLIISGTFVRKSGKQAVRRLLDNNRIIPDAIVCANDDMAMGAVDELTSRNINVPEDIAVVGFDDQKDSGMNKPPLTTVRRPIFKLGEKAIDSILQCIDKVDVPNVNTLSTEPVIRMSCGCKQSHTKAKSEKGITSGISFSTATSQKPDCSLLPDNVQDIIQFLDVYRSLGYMRDIDRMKDYLQFAFPGMGIERCFYSIFKNNKVENPELLLSYSQPSGCRISKKGKKYSLKELIKEELSHQTGVFSFRLLSLVYDTNILGIMGYENRREFTILDSTLRTSFLVNVMMSLSLHHSL